MLGSLLYAKRVSEGSDFPEQELTVRGDLRRPSPKREVNDILLMSKASADTVSLKALIEARSDRLHEVFCDGFMSFLLFLGHDVLA